MYQTVNEQCGVNALKKLSVRKRQEGLVSANGAEYCFICISSTRVDGSPNPVSTERSMDSENSVTGRIA